MNSIRVLAIEDNPTDALLLQESLVDVSWAQITVETVSTLAQALQSMTQQEPDIVLLDLGLPDSQGLDTFRSLHSRFPTVAIVVVTGLRDDEAGLQAVKEGADDYLNKNLITGPMISRTLRYGIERKRLQLSLQKSEREYRLLFERNPNPMWVLDADTLRIIAVNRAAVEVYGYSHDEFLAMSIDDLGQDDALSSLVRSNGQPPRTGNLQLCTVATKTGRKLRVELLSEPISFADRDAVLMMANDLTAEAEAREQLQELNQTLEHQVAERTALAEYRANQLRILARELAQTEQRERRRFAQTLHDGLQQMLVAAWLATTRLTASQNQEDQADTIEQIRSVLQECLELSRSLTAQLTPPVLFDAGLTPALEWLVRWMQNTHRLTVTLDVHPKAPALPFELSSLIFEGVRELLFNVVKHAEVSRASVHVRPLPDQRLEVVVRDEGAGCDEAAFIAPQGADHFGLRNLRYRLELVGGDLQIRSAVGEGCTATLVVSVPPAHAADGLAQQTDELEAVENLVTRDESDRSQKSHSINVLVVDDHQMFREGLIRLLKHSHDAPYELDIVGEASSGESAIQKVGELQPDVVVMDIGLPGISGIEATREIMRRYPTTRVVGLSMHDREDMAREMRSAGAVAYLTKVGPPEELIQAICAVADGQFN